MTYATITVDQWEEAGLGLSSSWSPLLHSICDLVLNSKMPMMIVWGSELELYFNSAFTDILGPTWSRALGQPMSEVWAEAWPRIRGFVDQALGGEAFLIENFAVPTQRSGFQEIGYYTFSYTPITDAGQRVALLCVCTETTEAVLAEERLKHLQADLIHLSRVSAMEAMASSLAHEINQPLTMIGSYLGGAERVLHAKKQGWEEQVLEAIQEASAGVQRAAKIIRRTRDMLQRKITTKECLDAGKLVESALALSRLEQKSGLTIRKRLANNLRVEADGIQIQQVLLNLFRNAVDAMEDSSVRVLEVATYKERDMGIFCVSDTGSGLSGPARESLYHAFSSTKNDGLGVGLSISRTIVELHEGKIWAEDNEEGGTRFHFSLPLSQVSG